MDAGHRTDVDFLIALLSDKDADVRRRSVVALGASGDRRAIEPLMFALSRELALGAESFAVVHEVIGALERLPDGRTLDLLLKIEAQLVDYGSPGCRADLPIGAVVYHSKGSRRVERIVPREVHYKVFEGLRRISAALGDRAELIAERFHAYQLRVMDEEAARLMPRMAEALAEIAMDAPPADAAAEAIAVEAGAAGPETEPDDVETVGSNYFDHELIKRDMELQILEYISKNQDMLDIIKSGQRLKAGIQQAREAKAAQAPPGPSRPWRAFVR